MAVTVRGPAHGGAYYREFGWTVWIDGLPAFSGNERDCRAYARKMIRRAAREATV